MDRIATKDHFERENEETERLVRPAPKVKPPRKDKRRETVEPDKDPALDQKDPDLSMNYKDIGGSMSSRVLTRARVRDRFLTAEGAPKVKVKHKETGWTGWVNKDTLKERGNEYEVLQEGDDEGGGEDKKGPESEGPGGGPSPKKEEGPAESPRKKEEAQLQQAKDLSDEIEQDPALASFAKSLSNPESDMGMWPNDAPVHPAFVKKHPFLGKLNAKNFGDLRQTFNRAQHLKKYEQKLNEKWKSDDAKKPPEKAPAPEQKKPEAPKDEKKPEAPEGEKKPEAEKKEEKGEEPAPDPEKQKAVADAGNKLRELAKNDPALATMVHQLDGADPKSLYQLRNQIAPGETLKFPGLPEGVKTLGDVAEALKGSKPGEEKPEGKEPPKDEKKPEGDKKEEGKPEEKQPEPAKPQAPPIDTEKFLNFLENTFGLVRKDDDKSGLHPNDKAEVDEFVKANKFKEPDFQKWADEDSGTLKNKDGEILFPDEERKKHVPFSELAPEKQYDWIERFNGSQGLKKNVADLTERAAKDKNLAKVLSDLANPKSDLAQNIEQNGSNIKFNSIKKAIPELRTLDLPEGIQTVGDLVEAANEIHKPTPEPQRREVTERDYRKAKANIIETFPPDVAEKLLDRNPPIHPDDVRDMVETYSEASSMDDDELFEDIEKEGLYETDPDKVGPPATGKNKMGQEVPFNSLSPGEQAHALEKHRMFSVAVSLAARTKKVAQLQKKTSAPGELLGSIAEFTLRKRANETSEERDARATEAAKQLFVSATQRGMLQSDSDRYARWEQKRENLIEEHRQQAKNDGEEYDENEDDDLPPKPAPKEMTPTQLNKVLAQLGDDPAAKRLAVGYSQAGDYLKARHEFLDPDGEDPISENDSPTALVHDIERVGRFFDQQAKKYPKDMRDLIPVKATMRDQIMEKVRTLAPEKFPFVKGHVQELEYDDYEDQLQSWEKQNKKAIEARREWKRQQNEKKNQPTEPETEGGSSPYRGQPPEEDLGPEVPAPPQRPAGYLRARGSDEDREKAKKDLFHKLRSSSGLSEPEATKQAAIITNVLWRTHRFSSCSPLWTMTDPLSVRVAERAKRALYWGVEPYPKGNEGFAPYVEWSQVHQRDLGNKDFDAILKSAREWLRTPVLSNAVDGIYRDTQLRAALDLALRDLDAGKYSVGLQPPIYNMLLARLGGVSQTDTLLTDMSNIKGPITVNAANEPAESPKVKPGSKIKADGDSLTVKQVFDRKGGPVGHGTVVIAENPRGSLVVCNFNTHNTGSSTSKKWEGLHWFKPDQMDQAVAAAKKVAESTTVTARESVYAVTGEEDPMKASAHIRSFAAKYASTNPTVAYDLIDLSTKLAQQEEGQEQSGQQQQQQATTQPLAGKVPPQFLEHMKGKKDDKKEEGGQGQQEGQQKEASYTELRSAVIKMAHANPHLREAYRPLLETIKKLG
jgi:hypothetical protein